MKCLVVWCEREATTTVSLLPDPKPTLCERCKRRLLGLTDSRPLSMAEALAYPQGVLL